MKSLIFIHQIISCILLQQNGKSPMKIPIFHNQSYRQRLNQRKNHPKSIAYKKIDIMMISKIKERIMNKSHPQLKSVCVRIIIPQMTKVNMIIKRMKKKYRIIKENQLSLNNNLKIMTIKPIKKLEQAVQIQYLMKNKCIMRLIDKSNRFKKGVDLNLFQRGSSNQISFEYNK